MIENIQRICFKPLQIDQLINTSRMYLLFEINTATNIRVDLIRIQIFRNNYTIRLINVLGVGKYDESE